jgi:hypothetical protein
MHFDGSRPGQSPFWLIKHEHVIKKKTRPLIQNLYAAYLETLNVFLSMHFKISYSNVLFLRVELLISRIELTLQSGHLTEDKGSSCLLATILIH